MTGLKSHRLRRRLLWTAVLVLVALGGAGLATAADRPAGDEQRPELSSRSDARAYPWLQGMRAQLHALDARVVELTHTAREVLAMLQRLDAAQLNDLLGDGEQSAVELEIALIGLADMRERPPAGLDEARLGAANRALLSGVDRVVEAVEPMPGGWRSLTRTTRDVASLLATVFQHESLVFRATAAAREERWDDALEMLDEGHAALVAASVLRDQLAGAADLDTLDELLARYVDYRDALAELYVAARDGLPLDGPEVAALLARVDGAQAALPADTAALRVVVNETAAGAVASAVLALERARGVVAQVVGSLP